MLRSILAVLAGILVMGITVAAVQWLGHSLYPPPADIDPTDHDAMIALISQMPKMALGITEQTYTASEQTNQASQELARLGSSLQSQVQRFRL